jgi:hypothetical protein
MIGDYIIALAGGLDNNYDFDYVDGLLTITAVVLPPAPPPPPPAPVTPPQNAPSTPMVSVILPPTVENSLNSRFVYQIPRVVQSMGPLNRRINTRIVIIPASQSYSGNDADNDFLIAITDELQRFGYNYNSLAEEQ